ncbi:MAG: hypothetical protein O3A73_05365 [Proteobacteria bacterium]|nr:hypothetical protein [Pseudomonadota bacterium]
MSARDIAQEEADRLGQLSATGVNDFRHAINLGYTEPDGSLQRAGLGGTQHAYADYETALVVDRANQYQFDGRSDWTGEQVQASPWVKQKADDIYERGSNRYLKLADERIAERGLTEDREVVARQIAFEDANKHIGDFFDKHTASSTYELQPFVDSGHLQGLQSASYAEREAYLDDPRSRWDTAPGGRDALLSGMRLPGTGYAVRVRPTVDMQGIYTPPRGKLETNPGKAARSLVAFDNSGKVKTMTAADRSILDAVAATRGYLDVQGGSTYNKPWTGGAVKESNDIDIEVGGNRVRTLKEIETLQKLGSQYGIPDVIDNGTRVEMTTFGDPVEIKAKQLKALQKGIDAALPDAQSTRRASLRRASSERKSICSPRRPWLSL